MADIIDMKRPGARALQKEREALEERGYAFINAKYGDPKSAMINHEVSVALKAQAKELRQVDEVPPVGAGGEFLPTQEVVDYPLESKGPCPFKVRDELLHNPDAVSLGASAERLRLMENAGISELGVDTARSSGAQNSNEQMLTHQMALCHTEAFKTILQAGEQEDTIDQVRLLNAGARLMKTFQEGALILHKLQTGGKQVVVVQHVNVTEGGQAVIAGSVGGGAMAFT
jgi:hypothetical protein